MNPFALTSIYTAIWMGAVMAPVTTQFPLIRRSVYGE